jgi:hypothetical protein
MCFVHLACFRFACLFAVISIDSSFVISKPIIDILKQIVEMIRSANFDYFPRKKMNGHPA